MSSYPRFSDMLEGDLSNKAQSLIQEWGKMHQDDLLEIWNSQHFKKLKPLIDALNQFIRIITEKKPD
jgi:hypothetical protein